jgi:hypothetical protein
VNKGGSKIDNLDLVEVLVLFKENVLGLQVSVNNFVLMTVVNTRKNLLDQNCTISLSELSSGNNFVEKLSSFANSKMLALYNYSVIM